MSRAYDSEGRVLKVGGIIINNNDEILLYKSEDRGFSFPIGHLEVGETPENGALREVLEETGLSCIVVDYLPDIIYLNTNTSEKIALMLFVMKQLSGELKKEENEDFLLWVSFDEAVEKLISKLKHSYFNLSEYLIENRNKIFRKKVLSSDGSILKAGALVYRNCGNEFLLSHRYLREDYSFPKGHLEQGESYEEAAVREVFEETGCKIRIIKQLADQIYHYPESGKVCVKMFLAECLEQGDNSEIDEKAVWVKRVDMTNVLSYENLRDYFVENTKGLSL